MSILVVCGVANAAPAKKLRVEVRHKPVKIATQLATVGADGRVEVTITTAHRTCAQIASSDVGGPHDVWLGVEITPLLRADGSFGWSEHGVSSDNNSSTALTGGRPLLDAAVELKPGGHTRFTLANDDGTAESIDGDRALTALGAVDATVCAVLPRTPMPASTGFVDVAGNRFPVANAILTSFHNGNHETDSGMTLTMVTGSQAATCKSRDGDGDLALVYDYNGSGSAVRSIMLTGNLVPTSPAGPTSTLVPHRAPSSIAGDSDLELTGTGELRDQAVLDHDTGVFTRATGDVYPVTIGGKVHVIDCRTQPTHK